MESVISYPEEKGEVVHHNQNEVSEEGAMPANLFLEVYNTEFKRGYRGIINSQEYSQNVNLYTQEYHENPSFHKHPLVCFGRIYSANDKYVTICCMVNKTKAIASLHSLLPFLENPSSLQFRSFAQDNLHAPLAQITCQVESIQRSDQFKSQEDTPEYDFAVLNFAQPIGDQLGFLGLLSNTQSSDIDILISNDQISLMEYVEEREALKQHSTLALDIGVGSFSVFDQIKSDAIAIMFDPQYGQVIIGVSTNGTLRQTHFNQINHEKFDILFKWIANDDDVKNVAQETAILPKPREYLENSHVLQSKLVENINSKIICIERINSNQIASFSEKGILKVWNWYTSFESQSHEIPITALPIRLAKSGQYLMCLTQRELIQFDWLKQQIESVVSKDQLPEGEEFTSICVLSNDTDVLVGATDSKIYLFRDQIKYSESNSSFEFVEIYADFDQQGKISSIVQINRELILVGFNSGSIVALINGNRQRVLIEASQNNNQCVQQIYHFSENGKIAVVLKDRVHIYRLKLRGKNLPEERSRKSDDQIYDQSNKEGQEKEEDKEQSEKVVQEPVAGGNLDLCQQIPAESDILAWYPLNEKEIGISWDNAIWIVNIETGQKERFKKDENDSLCVISQINSEGFITGSTGGIIRAWIIGASKPKQQPKQEEEQPVIQANPSPFKLLSKIMEETDLELEEEKSQGEEDPKNNQNQDDYDEVNEQNDNQKDMVEIAGHNQESQIKELQERIIELEQQMKIQKDQHQQELASEQQKVLEKEKIIEELNSNKVQKYEDTIQSLTEQQKISKKKLFECEKQLNEQQNIIQKIETEIITITEQKKKLEENKSAQEELNYHKVQKYEDKIESLTEQLENSKEKLFACEQQMGQQLIEKQNIIQKIETEIVTITEQKKKLEEDKRAQEEIKSIKDIQFQKVQQYQEEEMNLKNTNLQSNNDLLKQKIDELSGQKVNIEVKVKLLESYLEKARLEIQGQDETLKKYAAQISEQKTIINRLDEICKQNEKGKNEKQIKEQEDQIFLNKRKIQEQEKQIQQNVSILSNKSDGQIWNGKANLAKNEMILNQQPNANLSGNLQWYEQQNGLKQSNQQIPSKEQIYFEPEKHQQQITFHSYPYNEQVRQKLQFYSVQSCSNVLQLQQNGQEIQDRSLNMGNIQQMDIQNSQQYKEKCYQKNVQGQSYLSSQAVLIASPSNYMFDSSKTTSQNSISYSTIKHLSSEYVKRRKLIESKCSLNRRIESNAFTDSRRIKEIVNNSLDYQYLTNAKCYSATIASQLYSS